MSKDLKYCKQCDSEKPLINFGVKKSNKGGLKYTCKKCISTNRKKDYQKTSEKERWAKLKREFGITREEYVDMLNNQNGNCAICNNPESFNGKKRLAVDHDHKTGRIRGLLCSNCNLGLGLFKDDKKALNSAITYLTK
jgi:hypothetical protein